jgi:hypothetical protein
MLPEVNVGEIAMNAHKVAAHESPVTERRRSLSISGLAVRIAIALVISWLIIMAFFVTGVISH